jgi:quinoprotein glucose dehydrogenase
MRKVIIGLCLLTVAASVAMMSCPLPGGSTAYRGWPGYGGGPETIRYSALTQINRDNVSRLQVAWTFDSGDASENSQIQSTPIMIDGVLYLHTPRSVVVALDAATGRELWRWTPPGGGNVPRSRGLTYWTDGAAARLFTSARPYLYSLDAKTGQVDPAFGDGGRIDLREGYERAAETLNVGLSTPGVIYKDLLIVGSHVNEDLPSAPGDIRAYDVRTGQRRWVFHTIPRPGEFGYETWPPDAWKHAGGANAWGGLSLDETRGLVFVPTGSAAFDFYGGDRAGDNLFANSLIALKAETGERVWHFQFVKHDIWDRDLPTAPSLVTLRQNGRTIDAVAQTTKSGHVFVFERETGAPIFPLEELPYPASDVEGEWTSPTQLLPIKPPAFARQVMSEDLITTRTPEAHAAVLEQFRTMRSGGQFVPPSLQGTIFLPGLDGGGTWGGAAFDPDSGLLYVNANEMAWILQLGERENDQRRTTASALYGAQCAACHGVDRAGSPPDVPSLADLRTRRQVSDVERIIRSGQGRMPGFPALNDNAVKGLAEYLVGGTDRPLDALRDGATPLLRYRTAVNAKLLDPDGYPGITPPWGTLNAIDLNAGEIRWQVPLGEIPDLVAQGLTNTGSPNFGGPVVTAGGLVFIGATTYDEKFRAFDKTTGQLLWETKLPAGNFATPATYEINGRQFVVVPAGGGRGMPSKAAYVAFALPE